MDDLLGEPMGYVAPTALRAPVPFVLAFGGNTGNVPVTLRRALELLIDSPEVDIREVSPLLRTQAVVKPGMEPQDDHWNMVAMGTTTLRPHDLLALTSQIEDTLGRERPFPWAPRTIDIDIITMGNEAIDDDILQLPHPRAHSRAFVLLPWLLIDPDAELPGYGRASDLVIETTDRHGVRDIIDGWYENPENVIADSNAILDAPTQTPSHASTTHLTALDEAPAAVGADDNVTSAEVKGHSESARMPMGETETGIIADDEPHTLDAPAAEPHGDQEQHHATPVALAPQAAGQTAADSGAVRPARRNFAAEWDAFAKTVPIDELHLERPWHDEPTPQRAESSSPNPLVAGHTLTGPADVAATAAGQRAAGQTAAGPRVSGPPARLTPTAPAPAISEPVTSVPAAPEPTAPEPVEDASTLLTFITDLPADASSSNERTPVADPETRLYQAPSFDEALETEKPLTPHTGVSWIPVSSGGARPPVPRHRAGDAPQDEAPHGSQALPLPNWNFAQKQVTIIDSVDETDGDATSGAHSATAATANSPSTPNVGEGKEPGDITVDPHLPEGTQIGALDTGNTPTVTVSRRGIFRPTHTGAVPVVKRDS